MHFFQLLAIIQLRTFEKIIFRKLSSEKLVGNVQVNFILRKIGRCSKTHSSIHLELNIL